MRLCHPRLQHAPCNRNNSADCWRCCHRTAGKTMVGIQVPDHYTILVSKSFIVLETAAVSPQSTAACHTRKKQVWSTVLVQTPLPAQLCCSGSFVFFCLLFGRGFWFALLGGFAIISRSSRLFTWALPLRGGLCCCWHQKLVDVLFSQQFDAP